MNDRTITLDATPANDTTPMLSPARRVARPVREAHRTIAPGTPCEACGEFPAEGSDGLCPVCITDINAHLDAGGRYLVGDDEGACLAAGVSVDDGARYV